MISLSADAPFVSRPSPKLVAGALALGVHALFLLVLVFGVSWQTQQPAPVMVDLWAALPETPRPIPAAPRQPKPKPLPVAKPPRPEPVIRSDSPPKTPDIALEKKKAEAQRLEKQKAMQADEEKALADAARAEADAMKRAREKQQAEQKKHELLRQMEEDDLTRRMADEDAENKARQMKIQAEARLAASKRQAVTANLIQQHRDQISAKVRGNTRLPDGLKNDLEVRCLVKLLPTGEVRSVRVTQSSGNPAFDEAVVRAIEKSSPLPLPADRDARAEFLPELSLVHRSNE
jgi:colicin import membrane protein